MVIRSRHRNEMVSHHDHEKSRVTVILRFDWAALHNKGQPVCSLEKLLHSNKPFITTHHHSAVIVISYTAVINESSWLIALTCNAGGFKCENNAAWQAATSFSKQNTERQWARKRKRGKNDGVASTLPNYGYFPYETNWPMQKGCIANRSHRNCSSTSNTGMLGQWDQCHPTQSFTLWSASAWLHADQQSTPYLHPIFARLGANLSSQTEPVCCPGLSSR